MSVSRSVSRWWHEGPVPAHRVGLGVTSQHLYGVGISRTGMGPGAVRGVPFWDGRSHSSPSPGMGAQRWNGASRPGMGDPI